MSPWDRIAATFEGRRSLAIARLSTAISEEIWTALDESGKRFDEVNRTLTRRQRRALRKISTTTDALAAFLFECGKELTTQLVPAGQPRAEVLAKRVAAMGDRAIAIGRDASGVITTGDGVGDQP